MEKVVCSVCGKEMEGHTKKQVDTMLMQHIVSRHPNRVKFVMD